MNSAQGHTELRTEPFLLLPGNEWEQSQRPFAHTWSLTHTRSVGCQAGSEPDLQGSPQTLHPAPSHPCPSSWPTSPAASLQPPPHTSKGEHLLIAAAERNHEGHLSPNLTVSNQALALKGLRTVVVKTYSVR